MLLSFSLALSQFTCIIFILFFFRFNFIVLSMWRCKIHFWSFMLIVSERITIASNKHIKLLTNRYGLNNFLYITFKCNSNLRNIDVASVLMLVMNQWAKKVTNSILYVLSFNLILNCRFLCLSYVQHSIFNVWQKQLLKVPHVQCKNK